MPQEPAGGIDDNLSIDALQRIDAVCLRFEEAWQAGQVSAIETFLADASDAERPRLLRELLRIEWEYRRTRGEEPTAAEYASRFPTFGRQIAGWWAEQPEFACEATPFVGDTPSVRGGDSSAGGARTGAVGSRVAPDGCRYRVVRSHAKGGLGEVFVAEDLELRRQVALKEIQSQHAIDPDSRGRFLLEAEITGGLEHPGVVPIYGLGVYPDGRPYYAMRFIEGESLKEAVAKYHTAGEGAASLTFRTLLNRFVAVCNAVAYAHSRGVLHRDLKPANIMLGSFGETLVVDWGLAKVVRSDRRPAILEAEPDPMNRVTTNGSSRESTQTGQVVGTPAYMSPEQAAGRLEQIGPASDIYGLGATLYHLLTGQAPFEQDDVKEIMVQARAGAIVPPRRVKPAVPAALEAICLKALALAPKDRYATALELAEDLEHWLADEPVTTYREPLWTRTRRWARKHPSPVAALAATVFVAIVGLSVGALLLGQKNRQLELARQEAVDEKQIAQTVRRFLQLDLLRQADATVQANRMLQLGESGSELVDNPTIRELLDRAAKDLTPERIEQKFPQQPRAQAEILHTIGDSYRGVGEYNQAVIHLERSVELNTALLGADHPDTLTSQNSLAGAYRAAGRWAQAISLFEQTLQTRRAKFGADHPDTLTSQNNLALAYQAAGWLAQAIPLLEQTLQARRTKLEADHPDTLTSQNNLATAYQEAGQRAQAIPLLEQTLQTRKAKQGADHPDTLTSQSNLAMAYRDANRLKQAIPSLEQILQTRRAKLGADHPDTLTSQNNLALAYQDASRLDKAIPLFEQTLPARKARLGADHPETLNAQNNLARAYQDARRLDEAIPLLEQTLQARKVRLGADHPQTLVSQNNLATAYLDADRLDEAIPLLEQTLPARKAKFGADHPLTLTSQNNLARAYKEAGRLDEAIPLYEQTLQTQKAKLEADHPHILATQNNLARAYQEAGRLDEAIPLFEQAFQGAKGKLGLAHSNTIAFANNLGRAYEKARQFDKMEKLLQERQTQLREKFTAEHPSVLEVQAMLALCHLHQGKFAEAEALLKACLPLREKKAPEAWTTFHTRALLGAALAGQKKIAAAESLLLAGYAGMKQRETKIPKTSKHRLTEVEQWLSDLYEAWGKPDEAKKWRPVREKLPMPGEAPNQG